MIATHIRVLPAPAVVIALLLGMPCGHADGRASALIQTQDNHARSQYGAIFPSAYYKPNSPTLRRAKGFLSASFPNALGVCGDSQPDVGEECDDGNVADGDGCSSFCTIEPNAECTAAVAGITTENILVNGSFEDGVDPWISTGSPFAPVCSPLTCGDNDFSYEQEGGGWFWSGGAPSASATSATQTLTIPASASALEFALWPAFCMPDGGSGDFVIIEIDGNEVFNSGACTTGAGYVMAPPIDLAAAPGGPYNDDAPHSIAILGSMDFTAGDPQTGSIFVDKLAINVPLVPPVPPTPSACLVATCGDGIQSSGEFCDDGNASSGDGCSASCTVEEDFFACDQGEDVFDVLGGSLEHDEDISDGGLEEGRENPFWEQTGTVFLPICSEFLCSFGLQKDGAFFAWFGGVGFETIPAPPSPPYVQTLTQSDVTISADAIDLSFDLHVGVCDSSSDHLLVNIDGTEVYRYDCFADTDGYERQSIDLAAAPGGPYTGGQHSIVFKATTFATNLGNSNFFVDNISINYPVSPDRAPNAGSCTAFKQACGSIEKFESGIPAGWTHINWAQVVAGTGADWGTTNDGMCGSGNWPGGNTTGGSGEAACIDSDAFGPGATRAYLCTPELDLSAAPVAQLSFLANYQTPRFDDDGDPNTPSPEFLSFVIGTTPPTVTSVSSDYIPGKQIVDNFRFSLDLSKPASHDVDLSDYYGESSVWVCAAYGGIESWYAGLDNVALRADDCAAPYIDTDGDGEPDFTDPDDDGDGLPDQYEIANGLNPLDDSDAGDDEDQDGLTNLEEYTISPLMNISDPDTDGDYIGDAFDADPLNFSNICGGGNPDNVVLQQLIVSELTCAARESVAVNPPTRVLGLGHLELIAPTVVFETGFQSGRLSVINADPCPACTLLSPTFEIGDTGPAGGIVFYVTDGGTRGLEAAPVDQATPFINGADWGCFATDIDGADATAIGTGVINTDEITPDGCPVSGIAASLAADYVSPSGFSDWYLPSKDELDEMHWQIGPASTLGNVGGFYGYYYWSSSEIDENRAWLRNFDTGVGKYYSKQLKRGVRAIRAF